MKWEWETDTQRRACVGECGYTGKRMALGKLHSTKQHVQGGLRAGQQCHGTNHSAAIEEETKLRWVHRDEVARRK